VKETYSKVREEYRLDGCAICLDHIPTAGWFVEIEGSQRKIRQIAHLLGLRGTDRIASLSRKTQSRVGGGPVAVMKARVHEIVDRR